MPWKTPSAVCGLGSPEPPFSTLRQNTYPVRSPITSMSASRVLTSGPVKNEPPSDSTRSP